MRQDYDEGTTLDGNAIDSVVGGVSGAAKTNQPSPLGGGGGDTALNCRQRRDCSLRSSPRQWLHAS